MNIFVLDNDIDRCAQYHCDKHVVKMILETAQLLCAQHEPGQAPYKRTHFNHPCSKWVRESIKNYLWTVDFGLALCKEYTHRYGKRHKSQDVIEWCEEHIPIELIGNSEQLTPFAQAMPDEYKSADAIKSYRNYYKSKQDVVRMHYTNRTFPGFLLDG